MTHSPIENVEVSLNNEDGTYRLQRARIFGDGGRSLLTTVTAQSIPEGLRAIASEIEKEGYQEFWGRALGFAAGDA